MPTLATDNRTRLLSSILPEPARALLADGLPPGYVSALYPVTPTDSIESLLDELWRVAGFHTQRDVMGFMQHVAKAWTARDLSRSTLMTLFPLAGPSMVPNALRLQQIGKTVGTYHADTFNGSYRCLARTIETLSLIIGAGDAGNFNDRQLSHLTTLMDFWFAVLDFDGKHDRAW